ncbi:hypothetical protein GCM10023189_29560 [Nibrella saemangeumensis]|uniref:Uncharacterized protein n=1 Tax=Nibrella saemangeumensis TaxID=1084526 RepID=A0ABP8N1A3_9BACT
MALFDKLLAPFRKKEPNADLTLTPFLPEPAPASLSPAPAASMPPPQASFPAIPTPVDQDIPAWMEDEDLLRDEGVIFGLSDAKPEEKIAAIRTYFVHRCADLERDIERYNEKIGELNLFIEQKENRIGELDHRQHELANRPPGDHHLPRTIIGLTLSTAMCVGNYFLIEETLRPAFEQSRLISVGIFLAGMFNLFSRTSFFHENGSPATRRRLLEEIGLPLAAALFVFAQAVQRQPFLQAMALLVFVFFLFLLSGKLLLGTLTVLRNDLRIYFGNKQLKNEQKTRSAQWEAEIDTLRKEIDELRVQKWQIIPDLNRAEAEFSRMNARRDMLIKLFESEYNLARTLKTQLTERQRQAILRGR